MTTADWHIPADTPRCVYADTLYRTAKNAIFNKLTKDSTQEQFQAALDSLRLLRQELEQDMPAMHYAALVGTHRCVKDLYREAEALLRSLQIMQPAPEPQPAPPAPKPRSLSDVIKDFTDMTDEDEPDRE
jgi:hypothetical protein